MNTISSAAMIDGIPVELPRPCRLVFCVPVYDEPAENIIRLLSSLAHQQVPAYTIAAVLVVNNRPKSNESEWKSAFDRNQIIRRLPLYRNQTTGGGRLDGSLVEISSKVTSFIVDRSSPGKWVEDSNVGRARKTALDSSVRLFEANGHNGIIVHTDADCWFEDPQFAAKLMWLFRDPTLIGLAGANHQQIDPDDPESAELFRHLETYIRFRRYHALATSIRQGHVEFNAEKTLGRCIAHRAFEGLKAGGIPPLAFEEDIEFGNRLREYGSRCGMRFVHGRKWGIGPISDLRISDRTPNSIRKGFLDRLNAHGQIVVEDVLHGSPRRLILTDDYVMRLADVVAALPGGPEQLEYLFVTSSLANIRVKR